MFWLFIAGGAIYLILQFILKPDPVKLLGIYGQPGKWYVWAYFAITNNVKERKDISDYFVS